MIRPTLVAVFALVVAGPLAAQDPPDGRPEPVTLEKVPVIVRPPAEYQIRLALEPASQVTLAAAAEGPIAAVLVKPGQKVAAQAEIARTDTAEPELLVERAKAAIEAAENDAQKAVAEIDLKLAQLRLDRSRLSSPMAATVTGVGVVPGQYVRVGEPVATVADLSKLIARVPVERGTVKEGDATDVLVEGQSVSGTVLRLEPADGRMAPLRDLFESLAVAVVEIDNGRNALAPGQAVRSPLIPREAVIEADNAAIGTSDDGGRRVFVLRQGVAVAVPVQPLGAISQTRTFLSGRFGENDELVVSGSELLTDGALVTTTAPEAAPGGLNSSRSGSGGERTQDGPGRRATGAF